MLKALANAFKVPDLKRRILFTLALLIVYRIGAHIPTPGIDPTKLSQLFQQGGGGLFDLIDLFAGGAFKNFTIFAMGIIPYINASIIMQLLQVVIPQLEKLAKEGEEGRRKINQYTRYGAVFFGALQAFGLSIWVERMGAVANPGWVFTITMVMTLTAGVAFLMWLGERITESGIGNGISLIIFTSIISRYPFEIKRTAQLYGTNFGPVSVLAFLAIAVIVIGAVVLIEQGQRQIPVRYAKRVVGRKVYGGQSTYIPLRVNHAGVIPVIFAVSLLAIPGTIAQYAPEGWGFFKQMGNALSPSGVWYNLVYCALIIFFTYFYTAITFNPIQVADNMKKYGGFIPGIRPGKTTADYLDRTLSRITLTGAIFLASIAILPQIMIRVTGITTFYFGGTSLLIIVGVAMDTMKQIESHLLMRHYEGFMKKGRLKGRQW